ncbi:hypothetical protein [Halorussus salinus]|uniref:hypothetical protein n=1 Tax=Halorussus salinus TaxID=1364935 RepID=UPI00192F1354|nr:hypothetical protein [Halorussus salinus]
MTDSEADRRTTIDHETVRRWVERRGGHPAAVAPDAPEEAGLLRILFPGEDDEYVERLDWETFFERFEDQELALVYREEVGLGDADAADADSADTAAENATDDDAPDPSHWYQLEDRVFVGEF